MTTNPIPEEIDRISDRAKNVADNVKAKANRQLDACEKKIRQDPAKAVLIAVGAGYCLSRLPLAALIAVPLRLTALLIKPALLVLGAAKLCDIAEKQSRKR